MDIRLVFVWEIYTKMEWGDMTALLHCKYTMRYGLHLNYTTFFVHTNQFYERHIVPEFGIGDSFC